MRCKQSNYCTISQILRVRPSSPILPYTPLFRSSRIFLEELTQGLGNRPLTGRVDQDAGVADDLRERGRVRGQYRRATGHRLRSEEQTYELKSPSNIVYRLMLVI